MDVNNGAREVGESTHQMLPTVHATAGPPTRLPLSPFEPVQALRFTGGKQPWGAIRVTNMQRQYWPFYRS